MGDSVRRFHRGWIALGALLLILGFAGIVTFFVPQAAGPQLDRAVKVAVACPQCKGAGKVAVMGSHPEAMGSGNSSSGKLIEIGCPSCDGKGRVTVDKKSTGEPPAPSGK